jgi:hypothetical protein
MMSVTWVLEREVFADGDERLGQAALDRGHEVISWNDRWADEGGCPSLDDEYVMFHGSLSNADRIATRTSWRPGAFCDTPAFACSAWCERAAAWLVQARWVACTVAELVNDPERHLESFGSPKSFFVRPDSPLKPFSGRVIELADLSLEALDYGFYYEDENLPIIVTPVVDVGQEWRFVVCDRELLAASSYEASNRSETDSGCPGDVREFAARIAANFTCPDPMYVLDVCRTGRGLKLLEINPFSGADLYACDRAAIVASIERLHMSQAGGADRSR